MIWILYSRQHFNFNFSKHILWLSVRENSSQIFSLDFALYFSVVFSFHIIYGDFPWENATNAIELKIFQLFCIFVIYMNTFWNLFVHCWKSNFRFLVFPWINDELYVLNLFFNSIIFLSLFHFRYVLKDHHYSIWYCTVTLCENVKEVIKIRKWVL